MSLELNLQSEKLGRNRSYQIRQTKLSTLNIKYSTES